MKKATNKAIYIATTEPNSGKSIVSLGLMQLLLGKATAPSKGKSIERYHCRRRN
jgi:BioD-like phosphotransacetylase family protein